MNTPPTVSSGMPLTFIFAAPGGAKFQVQESNQKKIKPLCNDHKTEQKKTGQKEKAIQCCRSNSSQSHVHKIGHPLFFPRFPFHPIPEPLPANRSLSRVFFISISCPTAVLTASSKTSSTPLISLLLHSTYIAFICRATRCPCSGVTGVNPWVLSKSMQERFVRRSDLRPTSMSGVVGQKWRTSGYHWMNSQVSFPALSGIN